MEPSIVAPGKELTQSYSLSCGYNSFFGDHVLLEFAVRHFVDDDDQILARVFYFIDPLRHPATGGNVVLCKALGSAQRTKTASVILECLFGEIGICVVGEQRPVDLARCNPSYTLRMRASC